MSYSAFPIADFKTGLFTAREAWISPPDAFPVLENANIFRGRLKKRAGYKLMGYFPTRNAEVVTGITKANPAVVTMAGAHGLSNNDVVIIQSVSGMTQVNNKKFVVANKASTTFELKDTDSSAYSVYSSAGTVDQLLSLSYSGSISAVSHGKPPTITTDAAHGLSLGDMALLTGDFGKALAGSVSLEGILAEVTSKDATTFELGDVDTTGMAAWTSGGYVLTVSSAASDSIVGLDEIFQDEIDNKLVVCNQARIGVWSAALANFIAVSTADIFTGDNTNLFHMANGFSRLWITNFKDNVYSWDGTTQVKETFDITGDGGASPNFASHNDLNRCRFIFQYGRRLVLLNTVETNKYPQRARWSRIDFGAGTTSQWDDTADDTTAGSLDADTDEEIVGATFLRDTLIVFFERSIWALNKTGRADIPFSWQKLAEHPAVFASPFGIVSHDQLAWALSPGGMIATDGNSVVNIDNQIPDFEDEVTQTKLDTVFSSKVVQSRETWNSYATDSAKSNEKTKVLDYENNTWAEYQFGYNCMSEFTIETSGARAWQNFTMVNQDEWENTDRTWRSYGSYPGKPLNVIGTDDGIITKINDTNQDNGRFISTKLDSVRMNPFKEEGKACRLGWVDFLINENPSTSFTVEFFTDWDPSPHTTDIMTAVADTVAGQARTEVTKVWKRVYIDAIGNSHRFRIRENGNPGWEIHAIVPYFRPEGRLEMI